jgi:hypothetical protein
MKIKKKRIQEAAAKCSTAKEVLKTLFPEAFIKPDGKENKDYEILSFLEGESITVSKRQNGFFHYENVIGNHSTLDEKAALRQSNRFKIHSVKRLSDGEIFTIGDKLFLYNKIHIIEGFEIKADWDGGLRITFEGGGAVAICTAKKYVERMPLFRTEDGVGLFEGDKYFVPQKREGIYTLNIIQFNDVPRLYDDSPRFSTKNAAERWVLRNQPILSVDEILDLLEREGTCKPHWKFNKTTAQSVGLFTNYVREKIKK